MDVSRNFSNDSLLLDNLKKYVLPLFSLENCQINMVKFKDTEKQRAVFKIDTFDKSYCLKKIYYNEENLLFVYSAMEWLSRNDLSVPKLIPSIDGNRYVSYQDNIFILSSWVNGEKCDFDKLDHIMLSAETLGKLHKCSKHFIPISGSANRTLLENYNFSINKHLNILLQNANYAQSLQDKFSKLFLKNFNYNLELTKLSLELSSEIKESELNRSLCHGDYVNKNIIMDNDKVNIIDFDKCSFDYSAHDIAYFLRRLLKRPSTNWNIDYTLTFFNSYNKNNNLTYSDYMYILAYLAFPQKYWKISRDYYKNIKKCNKNSFITILQKGIERNTNQLDFINKMLNILSTRYDFNI